MRPQTVDKGHNRAKDCDNIILVGDDLLGVPRALHHLRIPMKSRGNIEFPRLFGAFRFLLGGGTFVQLPLTRKRNSAPFSKVLQRADLDYWICRHAEGALCALF